MAPGIPCWFIILFLNVALQFTTAAKPGPVSELEAVPMSTENIYLHWKKPIDPDGLVTGYNIYIARVDDVKLYHAVLRSPSITDPMDTQAKLNFLLADTRYRITVYPTSKSGEGRGVYVEAKTFAASKPPGKPNFTWSLLPSNGDKAAVKVTWLPNLDDRPGNDFYVQLKKKGEEKWQKSYKEGVDFEIVVDNLDLGTMYEMRVIAIDGTFETQSDIEEIKTPGPPEEMNLPEKNPTKQPITDNSSQMTISFVYFITFFGSVWVSYFLSGLCIHM